MTAPTRPRITATDIAAAATRLAGCVLLDVVDMVTGPAVYRPRLAAFESIDDGEHLGADDDPSLVVLIPPGAASDLIREAGTPGRAAAHLNRQLRAQGVL